jgi:hypothetical protein
LFTHRACALASFSCPSLTNTYPPPFNALPPAQLRPFHLRSIVTRHIYTFSPSAVVHPRPPRRASHPARARASHSSAHPLPSRAHRQRHHHHLPFACAL